MTQTTTPTLTSEGLPLAGTYRIDPSHSMVEAVARHLMVTKVRGRFSRFSGEIVVGDRPQESSVEVTVDAASIETSDEQRDAHLRSADFLDVENHPTVEFRSRAVEMVGDDRLRVTGDLTIRGVTRPVVLDATFDGPFSDPWGGQRIGFSARTEIDREDWGLTWNVALESGGVLVGRKVQIELTVSAVKE